MLVHSSAGAWAFFAGPESAIYEVYLRWTPPLTYGRALMALLMGGMLLVLVLRERSNGWTPERISGGLLLAMLLGGAMGWHEGTFVHSRHFPVYTALVTVQLLFFLAALAVALLTSKMDRLLWLLLAVYATAQVFAIVMTSALSWFGVPGAWSPAPWLLQVCYALANLVMGGIATWRLALARKEIPVPCLLSRTRASASLMGWE